MVSISDTKLANSKKDAKFVGDMLVIADQGHLCFNVWRPGDRMLTYIALPKGVHASIGVQNDENFWLASGDNSVSQWDAKTLQTKRTVPSVIRLNTYQEVLLCACPWGLLVTSNLIVLLSWEGQALQTYTPSDTPSLLQLLPYCCNEYVKCSTGVLTITVSTEPFRDSDNRIERSVSL
jgi:hypothetical protein